ncbi:carboxylic ester hydrolase [Elysia marginata]|uniref:Carboxylic ester hydrolase n=1 Tax=Elysia marginata TaxID=1093978 RepID=A0AAV4F5P8_9GAST|nr:carboxylic ester hydrolase [Elysia marginata]
MAASWLLQAIYTSLLTSVANLGGPSSGLGEDTSTPSDQATLYSVLANTTSGVLRGKIDSSSQPTIFRYLGVPFARPPIGDLRFQAPVPAVPWAGVKDAFAVSPQCWQPDYSPMVSLLDNSEDCLYLNIYTPARDSSAGLLPVMVWIHGGGYFLGTGSTYNGTKLARQGGVVVVTINYRLGVFGFLSTEDSTMPGNYGLLDQIQAIKWVRDNIANFGGDPNSVTIFGQSAGSSSVSLLMLSPLAKGLFHRAIMESGVSLALWAHVYPTQRLSPVYGARTIGAANGCTHIFGNSDLFASCLRGVNASALVDAASDVFSVTEYLWLQPRVEKIFGVLPANPLELLADGEFNHVDTIRGFNIHENGDVKLRNGTISVTSKQLFVELMRNALKPYAIAGVDNLLQRFTDVYLGNTTDSDFIVRQASEAYSDLMFASPTVAELDLVTSKSQGTRHYLYRYDYRDSFSTMPSWISAMHGDELKHVFGMDQLDFPSLGLNNVTKTSEDVAMTRRMMDMWTSFAKTGNPTLSNSRSRWTPSTSARRWMMSIKTAAKLTEFSRSNVVDLFKEILQIFYGRPPSSANIIG